MPRNEFFIGAVLFNLHGFDLINELSNLLADLDKKRKMALWMQMRAIEIIASVLADRLMQNGTKIFVDPEEIHWPDGTVSKPCESETGNKKKKKKRNATAKDGVFGKIVHEYGPRKKASASASTSNETRSTVVVVKPQDAQDGSGDQAPKTPKRRGMEKCITLD